MDLLKLLPAPVALCFAALGLFSPAPGYSQARPNIVFILVDDLRPDELGVSGHPVVKTPNIDRLAREGAMFRNAFATTPLCSPSRANILTGQYARANGIIDNTNRSEQTHRMQTFPLLLNQAGYDTAFLGKWHMGNDATRRPGWDYWVCMEGQGKSYDPELNVNGQTSVAQGYVTDILDEHALRFINQQRQKPFLLYYSHKNLHPETVQRDDGSRARPEDSWRFAPPPGKENLYADDHIPRAPSSGRPPFGKPALLRKIGDLPPLGLDTSTTDEIIRERWRILAAVDESLGKLRDALETAGQLENTLIVFTSDQGFFYGEHGLRTERRLAYEEMLRIPAIVRHPSTVRAGLRPDQMVLTIDWAPTLLEIGGAPIPEYIQGRSMLPILKGGADELRDAFFVEYYSDITYPRIQKMGYNAIRTDDWKYIRYLELEGMDELYNLSEDPYEMNNLVNDPRAQGMLRKLRADLHHLTTSAGKRPRP